VGSRETRESDYSYSERKRRLEEYNMARVEGEAKLEACFKARALQKPSDNKRAAVEVSTLDVERKRKMSMIGDREAVRVKPKSRGAIPQYSGGANTAASSVTVRYGNSRSGDVGRHEREA
jgi:hypothetical protein